MANDGGIVKTKPLINLLTGLFLLLAFSFLGFQLLHKPRIFILHSYHKQMPWVERINQGIRKVLKDKAYINIRYFYMDTKRRNSKHYLNRINKAAISAIHAWKPDVLITFDNDAQTLVTEHFSETQQMKIIMAGVTDEQKIPKINQSPHMTAITEEIPVNAIREILSLIFRQQRRIYYLSDRSSSSQMLEKNIDKQNWGSYQLIKRRLVNNFQEWQEAVLEAGKNADILLVSIYNSIKDGKKTINPKKLIHWMNQNSTIPVVGLYESFILDGGFIAIPISSLEQGYSAAWLAMNLIEKKLDIHDIPILHGKTFSLFLDKGELMKRFPEVQVPVILEAFSNSPQKLHQITKLKTDAGKNAFG